MIRRAALALLLLTACPRPPLAPPPARPTAREPAPPAASSESRAPAAPRAPAAAPGDGAHAEPDVVGVVHVVARGETLYRISRAYGVSVDDLLEVNGLPDARSVPAGFALFVPGATRTAAVPPAGGAGPQEAEPQVEARLPVPAGSTPGRLGWPLKGVVYSKYGMRQGQHHDGIDIAAPEGTPVGAAADGVVVYAGVQSGYGSIVILRHAGGLLTVYAHASALLVKEGDEVKAGDPVARVGQSGRTSGPHLHFEVREGTKARNPLEFLR